MRDCHLEYLLHIGLWVCAICLCRYHSITLLKFMDLITDFFGGSVRLLSALSGQLVSPDPFPCCCCCCLPMVAINRCTPHTHYRSHGDV